MWQPAQHEGEVGAAGVAPTFHWRDSVDGSSGAGEEEALGWGLPHQ